MSFMGIYNVNEPLSQLRLLWEARGPFCWLPNGCSWKLCSSSTQQCFSVRQENWTRLTYHTSNSYKGKCSRCCNCMCISSYFYLKGRCRVTGLGWFCTKAPAIWKPFWCSLQLGLLHFSVKAALGGFSTQLQGDHTRTIHIIFEGRLNGEKKLFIINNCFPLWTTFDYTCISYGS